MRHLPPAQVEMAPASVVYLHGAEAGHPRVPWPAVPPVNYLGQLASSFQARLASERAWIEREDCDFYHTAVLRSGEVIPGAWDLRGSESAYTGGIELRGRRVLELGPATGYLSFYMDDQGADVVGFDVGYDVSIDLLPRPGIDPFVARNDAARYVGAVENSWWYLHREREARAKVVYGDIYDMPGDLGAFDVTLVGAILIHLRDPFAALAQAAARTTKQIVVTELIQDPDLPADDSLARFAPLGIEYQTNWWAHTPGVVRRMLAALGFETVSTTFHSCKHHLGHDLTKPAVDMPMFTIVAERPAE
jgi:SAM-dependent methyltransferase